MRNRGNVLNAAYFNASSLQCADCCFTACAWSLNEYVSGTHAMFNSNLSSLFCSHLCCKRSALTRSFETESTSGCPGNCVSVGIGNRYNRIVECGTNVSGTGFYMFLFFLFTVAILFLLQHYFLVASFLPAMVFLGPLRVRAFVLVRCPRVGSPSR